MCLNSIHTKWNRWTKNGWLMFCAFHLIEGFGDTVGIYGDSKRLSNGSGWFNSICDRCRFAANTIDTHIRNACVKYFVHLMKRLCQMSHTLMMKTCNLFEMSMNMELWIYIYTYNITKARPDPTQIWTEFTVFKQKTMFFFAEIAGKKNETKLNANSMQNVFT